MFASSMKEFFCQIAGGHMLICPYLSGIAIFLRCQCTPILFNTSTSSWAFWVVGMHQNPSKSFYRTHSPQQFLILKILTLIHFPEVLTKALTIIETGWEGGVWGRGLSYTLKWSPMYGVSKSITAELMLSLVAEFQNVPEIATSLRGNRTIAQLSHLLS